MASDHQAKVFARKPSSQIQNSQMRLWRGNFKYILEADEVYQTEIKGFQVIHPMFTLSVDGVLTLFASYASDGPSGLTFDTKLFIWAAFAHDAFYQMIRFGLLPADMRKAVDRELCRMLLEGRSEPRLKPMWKFRAAYIYRGLRLGGGPAADPKNRRKLWIF